MKKTEEFERDLIDEIRNTMGRAAEGPALNPPPRVKPSWWTAPRKKIIKLIKKTIGSKNVARVKFYYVDDCNAPEHICGGCWMIVARGLTERAQNEHNVMRIALTEMEKKTRAKWHTAVIPRPVFKPSADAVDIG